MSFSPIIAAVLRDRIGAVILHNHPHTPAVDLIREPDLRGAALQDPMDEGVDEGFVDGQLY